jgi:acetylornithine/succinyldiaminopimelate/putrescine aminotransferase
LIEAVMLAPPLTIDISDVDEVLERFGDAVAELGRAG